MQPVVVNSYFPNLAFFLCMVLLKCVHKISAYTLLHTGLSVLQLKHSNHLFSAHCDKFGAGKWNIADVQAVT